MYDVVVIGGGSSGLMAACIASLDSKVLLVDKNDSLGKKLLLTGGGRCNVTNNNNIDHIIEHIYGNGKFLYSAFSVFNNKDIIKFFNDRGVSLKEEDNGRMFPITNSSKTILDIFIKELNKNKVDILLNSKVEEIIVEDGKIKSLIINNKKIDTKSIILASGGKTYKHTGSNGDGYKLVEKLGHTITDLYPCEVPLVSNESFKDELKGLSLRNINLSVKNKNKVIVTHNLDMVFTHFGISGPAVLRCSSFAYKQIKKYGYCEMSLDSISSVGYDDLLSDENKTVKSYLKQFIPERYIKFLCDRLNININSNIKEISKVKKEELKKNLKDFKFKVVGTLDFDKAFVTGGGISLKEINPKTMESKIIKNLYFCGEVMDINAYTGGYNITCAFVTGYVAGKRGNL